MYRRWLISLVLLTACGTGSSEPDRVVRTDSAGIGIVVSTGEDRKLPWRFEPLWSVGGLADERLALSQLAAHEVSAGPEGRIYILDAVAKRVLALSSGGEVVYTLGREGGGPGELESPLALTVDGDGVVAVYDFAKGGLVRWSASGEVLELDRIDAMFWGPKIEVMEGGAVFATFEDRTDSSTRLGLLSWSPDAERTLARFTSVALRPADFPTCGQQGMLVSPLFSPELLWDAEGNHVAVSTGAAYVIDLHQPDRHVRSIRREISPPPVTEEMALRHTGNGVYLGAVDCTIPPDEAARGYGYSDVLPSVEALALSPGGEVWALRGRVAGEPNRTDVFGSDGSYLGTLEPGSPFPAAFLPGDRILVVETDALDVPVVAVYRVVRL
jgi:hypothetical protein